MTQREQIKALRGEVAELRSELACLRVQVAQSAVVHHHHYPVKPPALGAQWPSQAVTFKLRQAQAQMSARELMDSIRWTTEPGLGMSA